MSCNEPEKKGKLYLPPRFIETYGFDPRELEGTSQKMIGSLLMTVRKSLTDKGEVIKTKVRYKPREVIGLYISDEHQIELENEGRIVRNSGWIVQGPGGHLFYVEEQYFSQFFEIVTEEGEPNVH